MIFTDTHSHLYDQKFSEDRTQMIARAFEENVKRIFLPNIDSNSIKGMMELVAAYPEQCFPMIGLHPCHVKENFQEELAVLKKHLDSGVFYAVGEIGLDLHWDKNLLEAQKKVFRIQINWAKEKQMPIVIHCRSAFDEIFEILEEEKDEFLRGVFHCFNGTLDQAYRAINLNFFLGIGGILTFKKAGLDKVIQQIDIKHLVLETDSPYLSPFPNRGKRNESSNLIYIAQKLADLHEITLQEIAKITTHNSIQLFGH